MWILRHTRRPEPPCLRAFHAPSPSILISLAGSPEPVALAGPMSVGRCSGPQEPRQGMSIFRVFRRRLTVLKSGTSRSGPTSRNRLSPNPVVCPVTMPNGTFIVRPVRMTFVGKTDPRTVFRSSPPLQTGCRPRFPVGAAARIICGSNRIARQPRRLGDPSSAGRFRVLQAGVSGFLMPSRCHTGFTRRIPSYHLCNKADVICAYSPPLSGSGREAQSTQPGNSEASKVRHALVPHRRPRSHGQTAHPSVPNLTFATCSL